MRSTRPRLTSEVGRRIFHLRTDRELSLRHLGALAGVSYSSLSQIENGRIEDPGIGTLVKIADALGVPVVELLPVPAEVQ